MVVNSFRSAAASCLYRQIKQRQIVPFKAGTTAPIAVHQILSRPLLLNWMNSVFNRVSKDRVEEVGPDRACAEWLLRNGALVQWEGCEGFVTDYNDLPLDSKIKGHFYIKCVDATDSSIMALGFPYFEGCDRIEKIVFKKCSYLDDEALPFLSVLKNSLKFLEIICCWNITDKGIPSLASLSKLEVLKLEGLPEVKNKLDVERKLKKALPNCKITFDQQEEEEGIEK